MPPETDRQKNALLNELETKARKTALRSTPLYVTIGSHYGCNAKCLFCLGGDYPAFTFERYTELFEKKMGHVLQNASHAGFCGFGETLLMPGIGKFLDHVNLTLPGVQKVFTTNGSPLKPDLCDQLAEGRYAVIVSLHAANAALHKHLTRTDLFDTIVRQVKYLTALKRRKGDDLHINLAFLAMTENIDNLPEFVRFARYVDADRVSVNYLTIFDPVHAPLSCFFQQERTKAAFAAAEEKADKFGITLALPPKFCQESYAPGDCRDPWNFFYVETQGSVNPCCFAGNHIGYLDKDDFETIWNGPGYTSLRDGLRTGDIHTWCRHCYRFKAENVNDIRSHITFRPETQKRMLEYFKEHRNEFPLPQTAFEL
jgi:Radical SAM superfamily.